MEKASSEKFNTQEEMSAAEQQEYLALTREQTESTNWTEAKRTRLLELMVKLEPKIRTQEEQQEYLALTREQMDGTNWTPEKAARLIELQNRKPLAM